MLHRTRIRPACLKMGGLLLKLRARRLRVAAFGWRAAPRRVRSCREGSVCGTHRTGNIHPAISPTAAKSPSLKHRVGTVRAELDSDARLPSPWALHRAGREGLYDSLKFHAKKPGSVVLGGCPTTRTMGPAQVLAAAQGAIRGMHPGTGDARYTIIDEWEDNPRNAHRLGSLCMAHKSAPNPAAASSISRWTNSPSSTISTRCSARRRKARVIEQLAIGDAIKGHRHRGADEEASGRGHRPGHAAPSHAPGRPWPPSRPSGPSALLPRPQSRLRRSRSSTDSRSPKIRCRAEFQGASGPKIPKVANYSALFGDSPCRAGP